MRILQIFRKTILEWLREPQLLGLTLALPLVMAFVFGSAYGHSPRLATYKILVYDPLGRGADLVEKIRSQHYPDGRNAYEITFLAERTRAVELLKSNAAVALVAFEESPDGRLNAVIEGDATSLGFINAGTALNNLLQQDLENRLGKPRLVTYLERPLDSAGALTEFDAYAPGMIIFAIMMLAPQTAMLLGREARGGGLRRLQLTPLRPFELLAGISLAQMAVAVLQVGLIFGAITWIGYHNQGSIVLAFVIGLVLSASAVGMGLLVAGFVQDDSQALNVASSLAMVQVFLSGAMFPVAPVNLAVIGSYTLNLYDLFPATHGMAALQMVLTTGAGLGDIWLRLALSTGLSLLYFVLGAAVFGRMHMRAR